MVLVATQVKRRRGTTAENDAFTGAEGEITVDTEKHELRVHDGLTQGGHTIPTNETLDFANKALDNLSQGGEARFAEKADADMNNITSTGKKNVFNWGVPDYTAGVQVTTATQTAPKNGWVIGFMAYTGSNASGKVFINDIEISRGSTASGTIWGNVSVQIAIKAGQTYRYSIDSSATVQQNRIYFYPNNE